MARLRYNGLATGSAGSLADLTLSGSHNNSTTTLTFNAALTHSNGTAVPTLSGDYFMLSILDSGGRLAEIVRVTAYTSGGTSATVVRGQDGTSGVSHASGAKVVHGPSALDLPTFNSSIRTSGDITFNTTGWQDVDTTMDLTLSGLQVGDLLEYMPNFAVDNTNNNMAFDVATVVSGSPVNYFGATGGASDNGVLGWYCLPSQFGQVSGSAFYTVQSGDLSSGSVTMRLRVRPNTTTARKVLASANNPMRLAARRWSAR